MPPVIYVPIGIHGYIRCPVEAEPPVTLVKWNKDGRPLRIEKVTKPPGRDVWGHGGLRTLVSSANAGERHRASCGSSPPSGEKQPCGWDEAACPYRLWAELIRVLAWSPGRLQTRCLHLRDLMPASLQSDLLMALLFFFPLWQLVVKRPF